MRKSNGRILLLQTQAEFAGAQEVTRILGSGLEGRGYDVHHAFIYQRSARFGDMRNVFFGAGERPRSIGALWRALSGLRRHIAELKPDAVFTFQHYGNAIGAPIAKLAGADVVVANLNSSRSSVPWWVMATDVAYGAAGLYQRVVSNSATTTQEFSALAKVMGRRMVCVDHGVEAKVSQLDKAAARARFDLPAGATLLGCGGRLHPMKNQSAILKVLPAFPGVHLALAGGGSEGDALTREAQELGVGDRVHLLGEQDAKGVADFLAAIDVFVFPSLAESFGLAVVEAAERGLPVVCNELDVLQEVLRVDGKPCAIFVDATNPASLKDGIFKALSDPEAIADLTARGRRLSERFSLDKMIDGYVDLIRGMGIRGRDAVPDKSAGVGDAVPLQAAALADMTETHDQSAPVAARRRVKELEDQPKAVVGGVEILALNRDDTARLVIDLALARRGGSEPIVMHSANGEALSKCSSDAEIAALHREADILCADGQSLVFASRMLCQQPLPERIATTDFFHDVVKQGLEHGLTHYMFGATPDENAKAQQRVRQLYPSIRLIGGSHGYLSQAETEAKVAEINALSPDVLWVALGVPSQQLFCRRYGPQLSQVGVIETCGGLFNFLSGTRKRAPLWMQNAGLEWIYRLKQEPRRLFWRYAVTNPHAIYLLARHSS